MHVGLESDVHFVPEHFSLQTHKFLQLKTGWGPMYCRPLQSVASLYLYAQQDLADLTHVRLQTRAEALGSFLAVVGVFAPTIETRLKELQPGKGRNVGSLSMPGSQSYFALAEDLPDKLKQVCLATSVATPWTFRAASACLLHVADNPYCNCTGSGSICWAVVQRFTTVIFSTILVASI